LGNCRLPGRSFLLLRLLAWLRPRNFFRLLLRLRLFGRSASGREIWHKPGNGRWLGRLIWLGCHLLLLLNIILGKLSGFLAPGWFAEGKGLLLFRGNWCWLEAPGQRLACDFACCLPGRGLLRGLPACRLDGNLARRLRRYLPR
jgi:hypothetical protein